MRIVEDHEAGIALDHTGGVLDCDLEVRFGEQRQLGAGQRAHLRRVRARRIHEHRRGNTHRGAVGAGHFHRVYTARFLPHAFHAATYQLYASGLRFVEQIHAQLLTAEPSTSTRMQDRHDVVVHPRKVLADRVAIEEQIGTIGHAAKAAVRTALIRGRLTHRTIRAHHAGALLRRTLCIRHEPFGRVGIARRVQIAASIETEAIVTRIGPPLQQVDATIHQLHHRIVGPRPPIAIRFGALVAGEREWCAFIDQQHVAHAMRDRERMRRGNAGDAGAADDDIGRDHEVASRLAAARAVHSARSTMTGVNARAKTADSCAERSRRAVAYLA